MHPVFDIDAVLLLGLAICSKRRPAQLSEVIAAADLIQGFIPFEHKLGDGLFRLSVHGLVTESEGGYTLTDVSEQMAADVPVKLEPPERIEMMKEILAEFSPKANYASIEFTPEQYKEAVAIHKESKVKVGRNVLMPKPKADRHFKVEGKWRRVAAPRRTKAKG